MIGLEHNPTFWELLGIHMRPCLRCLPLCFILAVLPWPQGALQAQEATFQINAGIFAPEYRWDKHDQHPPETQFREWGFSLSVPFTGEFGVVFGAGSPRRFRVLVGASEANASFREVAVDYQWAVHRWGQREVYVFGGPSLHFLSGTYTFREGYVPPDGNGKYQLLSQQWRPGLKLGAGFQWSKHWGAEVALRGIKLATGNTDPAPQSTTSYGSVVVSFRFENPK